MSSPYSPKNRAYGSILLLASFFGLLIALIINVSSVAVAAEQVWYGLYTDTTSYTPGDTIQIYGSAPDVETVFRLIRLDADWTEISRTTPQTVTAQTSAVGSFIEYPDLTLSGRSAFTLEGWFYPTLLGGDTAVIAGQIGETESAAGIIIRPDGRLAGYLSSTPATNAANQVIAPAPADFTNWLDAWHHLALTYDGAQVILYVDGAVAAQRAQTGTVAQVTAPFRLGARSEAPGDLTGVIDGRIDAWAVWPAALNLTQIQARQQAGLTQDDPTPNLAQVDFYVGFEGSFPSLNDTSTNGYTGVVTNYGNPGVAGVTENGRAYRLNHDQIVDAGWQLTAQIAIPPATASGMYAIQALAGPDFTPTQTGDRLSVRAIAIKPAPDAPHAPIAVVLPTNTWNAYSGWPGIPAGWIEDKIPYGPDTITERTRHPDSTENIAGGNNSAYGKMGDDVSLSYFHGWRRPSYEASPMMYAADRGYYSVRAPNSMYLTQWLDMQGYDYDVFSDNDFDAGRITAADYRVLMPNSHHEYWTDGMLANLTQFLGEGGSVVAPAGNIFTWRVVYGENGVLEVRKYRDAPILGVADVQSGIDGLFMGGLLGAAVCNGTDDTYYGQPQSRALGVAIHATKPCSDRPFCFGQWAASNTNHWLWQGSGLSDNDLFGQGRLPGSYAVGHEMDTWTEGMPLPGLAPGEQAVILGEGTAFDPQNEADFFRGNEFPVGHPDSPIQSPLTCQDIVAGDGPPLVNLERAGTILYFPHAGGGHVLVIGASATPWALASDAALSGLLQQSLSCFAYDAGCGYEIYLPSVLTNG